MHPVIWDIFLAQIRYCWSCQFCLGAFKLYLLGIGYFLTTETPCYWLGWKRYSPLRRFAKPEVALQKDERVYVDLFENWINWWSHFWLKNMFELRNLYCYALACVDVAGFKNSLRILENKSHFTDELISGFFLQKLVYTDPTSYISIYAKLQYITIEFWVCSVCVLSVCLF